MKKLNEVPFDKIYVGMPIINKVYCIDGSNEPARGIISTKYFSFSGKKPIIGIKYNNENYIYGYFYAVNIHLHEELNNFNIYLDPTRM